MGGRINQEAQMQERRKNTRLRISGPNGAVPLASGFLKSQHRPRVEAGPWTQIFGDV